MRCLARFAGGEQHPDRLFHFDGISAEFRVARGLFCQGLLIPAGEDPEGAAQPPVEFQRRLEVAQVVAAAAFRKCVICQPAV